MFTLDTIDCKLIELLQDNARCSIKQVAEQVGMSPPAVAARLTRLEKAGAIKGYRAVLDPDLFGYNIVAYVNLELQPADKAQFCLYVESVHNVLFCDCVTGEYSMIMKVCFHSTSELEGFVGELQRFGKTNTQIVFSAVVDARNPHVDGAIMRIPRAGKS